MRSFFCRVRSLLFFFMCLGWMVAVPHSAQSHVESDMPDAVAEVEYLMLLDIKPRDNEMRFRLAMVYFHKQEYDKSLMHLQRVLKAVPDHFNALTGMGLVKSRLKEYDQAVEYFQKAIAANPTDNHIYYYLGQVLEEKGDREEAEKAYTKAIATHKKHIVPDDKQYAGDLAMFEKALQDVSNTTNRK